MLPFNPVRPRSGVSVYAAVVAGVLIGGSLTGCDDTQCVEMMSRTALFAGCRHQHGDWGEMLPEGDPIAWVEDGEVVQVIERIDRKPQIILRVRTKRGLEGFVLDQNYGLSFDCKE